MSAASSTKLDYDLEKDFEPIGLISNNPQPWSQEGPSGQHLAELVSG